MKQKLFTGAGVAVITPFNTNTSVDYASLGYIINNLIERGVDYIVLLGSTGEASTISKSEQNMIIEYSTEIINSRIPLIVGCSGNSTQSVISRIYEIAKYKIDGILSVAPYYNKPSQQGIYEHFKLISTSSFCPVIIYNVPGRTASNITAETCLKIADTCKNVVGIKEASGNMEQFMTICHNKPEDFSVLSGDDMLNLPYMLLGADGAISVVGNIFPSEYAKMIHLAYDKDFDTALKIHNLLFNFTRLIFREGNPAGIKAALQYLGYCDNILRLPLMPVSGNLYNEIANEIQTILAIK